MKRETYQLRKNYMVVEICYFKALCNRFQLTPKLIKRVREQQNCLCPTFYQIHFMKRQRYEVIKVKLDV